MSVNVPCTCNTNSNLIIIVYIQAGKSFISIARNSRPKITKVKSKVNRKRSILLKLLAVTDDHYFTTSQLTLDMLLKPIKNYFKITMNIAILHQTNTD